MNKYNSPVIQDNTSSVVAFRLDQRTFAMPLEVIVQILPMMTITPIPHLSRIVKGTINVRGEDILAISLRSHFGVAEEELQLYTPLLLLKLHNRSLAIIVDAVLDVMTLPLEKVTSLQNILPDGIENNPMLRGISYHNDEAILVLDPDHLFNNQHADIQTVIQNIVETRTSASSNTPAVERVSEDSPAPLSPSKPIVEKKPAAKKTHVTKKTPVAISAPIEDTPIAADAPAEDTPVPADAPAEETPVPFSSDSPMLENG